MAKQFLIKGGHVIDPANGIDGENDVLVVEGRIAEVGRVSPAVEKATPSVIHARGKVVTPGLIDIHVHFREPGDEEEETIASGSAAAVAGGFTSVVCMPNTKPAIDNETDVEYVHRKGRQARKTHVYVMGALTKNREGVELAEMGLMAEAGAVGFTDDGSGVQDPAVMLRAMKYAGMFGKVVAQHCEDRAFAQDGVMNAGYQATILGLPGMDALAEEAMIWRDIQLVKKTQVAYHAQHLSTAGAVELVRAARLDSLPVTCEVTPHHLLLTDENVAGYDTNYKMNPPLRSQRDIEVLKQAIADGVVDALATDHAPHLQSEKELEFLSAPFGIASLECALGLYIKALVEPGVIDFAGLIRLMTMGPANIIKIDKGTLGKGQQADITILDPQAAYTVDIDTFLSKSRNCPYQGWRLKGVVEKTIVGGEIRYDRASA
ncbi:dihydroorotase [Planctomycetota bacterium]